MMTLKHAHHSQDEDTHHADPRWSQHVTETSHALDLKSGIFEQDDPKDIAHGLKQAADASTRRRAPPFRSAMSMLVFYINRAGHSLPRQRLDILERAKDELRALYGKPRKAA